MHFNVALTYFKVLIIEIAISDLAENRIKSFILMNSFIVKTVISSAFANSLVSAVNIDESVLAQVKHDIGVPH